MAIVNEDSKPLAAIITSASPHELKLLDATFGDLPDIGMPEMTVGDRAYDSDPHDEKLKTLGTKLIAPHKSQTSNNAERKRA